MKILRTHFTIADNGHTGPLQHVQLDQVLLADSSFHSTLTMADGSRYRVVGLRSPASDYVTLKRLDTSLTPDQTRSSYSRDSSSTESKQRTTAPSEPV